MQRAAGLPAWTTALVATTMTQRATATAVVAHGHAAPTKETHRTHSLPLLLVSTLVTETKFCLRRRLQWCTREGGSGCQSSRLRERTCRLSVTCGLVGHVLPGSPPLTATIISTTNSATGTRTLHCPLRVVWCARRRSRRQRRTLAWCTARPSGSRRVCCGCRRCQTWDHPGSHVPQACVCLWVCARRRRCFTLTQPTPAVVVVLLAQQARSHRLKTSRMWAALCEQPSGGRGISSVRSVL
jgi:hypothetical protein